MFKFISKIVMASVISASLFTACNANFTELNESIESDDGSISARAIDVTSTTTKRLVSELDPGFGKAVYFTGTFNEGKNWTVAVRGTFDENKWYLDVTTNSTFEWKALTGSYDIGSKVKAPFNGLTWQNGDNKIVYIGKTYRLVATEHSGNGQYLYFTGNFNEGNNWNTAIRGNRDGRFNRYVDVTTNSSDFEWKVISAQNDYADKLYAPYDGCMWVSGSNKTKKDATTVEAFFDEHVPRDVSVTNYASSVVMVYLNYISNDVEFNHANIKMYDGNKLIDSRDVDSFGCGITYNFKYGNTYKTEVTVYTHSGYSTKTVINHRM